MVSDLKTTVISNDMKHAWQKHKNTFAENERLKEQKQTKAKSSGNT
jgi:hypothetical protein